MTTCIVNDKHIGAFSQRTRTEQTLFLEQTLECKVKAGRVWKVGEWNKVLQGRKRMYNGLRKMETKSKASSRFSCRGFTGS